MMSYLNGGILESLKDVPGLSRVIITRISEERMLSASGYIDKTAADATSDKVQNVLSGISEYLTEPPLIREGELVWLYQYNA